MISRSQNTQSGFLKIRIIPFQEGQYHFVRSPQMNFVARGDTPVEAVINFVNMVAASISVAGLRGNLSVLIKNSGVEVLQCAPQEAASSAGSRDIYFPLIAAADARARAVG
jgi:hypothetical protein